MKNFTSRKQLQKTATTEFLSKIPNRKTIYNEQFKLFETNISLDEFSHR